MARKSHVPMPGRRGLTVNPRRDDTRSNLSRVAPITIHDFDKEIDMALGHHLCLRLANDAVLAASPEERRIVARVILRQGVDADLLGFGLADNHLHLAPACDRERAGKLAQAVEVSLQHRLILTAPFAPAFIKPIEDARHLYGALAAGARSETYALDGEPRWPRRSREELGEMSVRAARPAVVASGRRARLCGGPCGAASVARLIWPQHTTASSRATGAPSGA
jgi:hypothetical protein